MCVHSEIMDLTLKVFRGQVGWGWGHPNGDGVGWGGHVGCRADRGWIEGWEWNMELKMKLYKYIYFKHF